MIIHLSGVVTDKNIMCTENFFRFVRKPSIVFTLLSMYNILSLTLLYVPSNEWRLFFFFFLDLLLGWLGVGVSVNNQLTLEKSYLLGYVSEVLASNQDYYQRHNTPKIVQTVKRIHKVTEEVTSLS
jgi:hypothetical protein